MSEELDKKATTVKPKMGKRTPLHKQQALGIKDRPGFMRYQVVEKPGMVERFQEAGWTLVGAEEDLRDSRLQHDTALGSVARSVVNPNGDNAMAKTAVWMEIPIEDYESDQADKQAARKRRQQKMAPETKVSNSPDDFYAGSLRSDKI